MWNGYCPFTFGYRFKNCAVLKTFNIHRCYLLLKRIHDAYYTGLSGRRVKFMKDISLLKKDSHEIVCFLLWFLVKQNIIKRNQNKNKINVELKALKRPVHGIFIPSCSVSRIYLKTEIFQQYNHTHTFWELSSIQVPNPLLFRLRKQIWIAFLYILPSMNVKKSPVTCVWMYPSFII